ncbi:hypothetical protein VNI00_009473 [Paramarasmius palmivorus]|uniref:Uncharacterized protein n=1 Tax=Paramarasmius palmivorus TaxID=297713 RepID=A0AAW0CQH9_9AGAR
MSNRKPYHEKTIKLIISLDVGTTWSGVSFSILIPGRTPMAEPVTRYPGLEECGGGTKIPTIIAYHPNGTIAAIGAEVNLAEPRQRSRWVVYEWFKLLLTPRSMAERVPPDVVRHIEIPHGKTPVILYADFFRYLFRCTKEFIRDTKIGGEQLLNTLIDKNRIEFVIPHPNGWEFEQQEQMKQAAVLGELIPDTSEGLARLHFVTEGEASLHFCIEKGLGVDLLADGVIIVDAGGGTIDISAYCLKDSESNNMDVEEVCESHCKFAGSTFITKKAREEIEARFTGTRYHDDVENVVAAFDRRHKPHFRCSSEKAYISFASVRDNAPELGIYGGQLVLTGSLVVHRGCVLRAEISSFFDSSIQAIVQTIFHITKEKRIMNLCLVGGLAASAWVFSRLQETLQSSMRIYRPDAHLNKAAADGGISFYIDHHVSVRVSKFTYGILCHINFNNKDDEHMRRRNEVVMSDVGKQEFTDGFDIILKKGTAVSEETEFRRSYYVEKLDKDDPDLNRIDEDILCYEGSTAEPRWFNQTGSFRKICKIVADVSRIKKKYSRKYESNNVYKIEYQIILFFGGPELKAQLCWVEQGAEKRSPAQVIYSH